MPWWVVATAGVIVAIATALWWWLPKWQVNRLRLQIRDPKARADVEDNFRKTIGQLLGGAAVLIGTGFAYYQSQLTQQASYDQIKASHDQIISQQVSKGFELLGEPGSDKLVVRLGGLYALEGVMNTSEQYHQPVLEALCAFVRDGTKGDTDQRPPDIQAALTVIRRRAAGAGVVDLTGSHISKAFLGDADLTKAVLNGANLSGANLGSADLTKANLNDANLGSADLTKANLNDAILTKAVLTQTVLDGANLSGANLGSANLNGAYLSGANLTKASLNDVDLSDADLSGANLTEAFLSGAKLSNADLTQTFLPRANLTKANLNDVDLSDADLSDAKLTKADLSGADLSDSNVSQSQLDKACGDKGTRLPSGLTLKPC